MHVDMSLVNSGVICYCYWLQ